MQPSVGRGRAALFARAASSEPDEPVSVGRGRAITVQEPAEEARPRGRGALFKQAASQASTSSSGVTGRGDADRKTVVSDTTFESGTALTEFSSGSGSDEPRKGRGRAAMFGRATPSSNNLATEVKQMTLTEKPKEAFTGPSPEKKEPVRLHGKQGRAIEATANYIQLEYLDPNRAIQEYEVSFNPSVDSVREKSFVINQHFRNFGGRVKVFDMGWRLFTPDRLHNDVNVASVTLRSGLTVEMTIKFKRTKPFTEIKSIINIIFKRIMGELALIKFGRSDFNPKMAHFLREYKLEIWPGFVTAIEEYEGGIMLNIDASHRVLRSQSCLDVIYDIARTRGAQHTNHRDDILKAFMGESVIANYNKLVYRIDDIDFSETPRGGFMKNGVKISYLEYYKTQYNIEIKDPSQPMLVHRARRKEKGQEKEDRLIYLIPELCSPCGLTENMRSDFKCMKAVADITRVSPASRKSGISDFIKGVKSNEKAHQQLRDWNLKLPDTTVDLTGRVMEPEKIFFGDNKWVTEANADWGRAASNNKMISAIDLHKWAILYFNKNNRNVNDFVEIFHDLSRRVGLEVNKPKLIALSTDHTRTYCEEIRKLAPLNPQILVIIFPTNRDDRYAAVKKLCNCELGLASQVINLRTISNQKSLRSVVTKVILQMNCKVGGALWGVTIPFKEEGIMFCGIDAYHDAARKTHSVVALVTSTNHTCTRWASGTSLHNRGQEISDVICGLLRECLELWHKANRTFPSRIVMYRDGVGDGQLGVVRDFEVPQFYKLFTSIRSDYKPKLTYNVVQKRINTRIFAKERNQFTNPPPGTVMDHSITRRDWFDYFLVSQNVRQGTVSPTHYVVVHDDSEMSVDMIQKLSYKMTHLYYNWNGTVRVPAPCQYAHKLAYLVGQHMHAPATENLRNVLFFL